MILYGARRWPSSNEIPYATNPPKICVRPKSFYVSGRSHEETDMRVPFYKMMSGCEVTVKQGTAALTMT